MPSTRSTLEAAARCLSLASPPCVVAPLIDEARSVQSTLSVISAMSLPKVIVVFSDQLTSAMDAPILVEGGGRRYFLPALELIANGRYGYRIHAWTDQGTMDCQANAEPRAVLRLIHLHLGACDALGPTWLLRDAQVTRHLTARTDQARVRLQALHSALMQAFPVAELPTDVRPALQHLARLQRSLAGA